MEKKNSTIEFGKRLKDSRILCGLTQAQVAENLNMFQQQYSLYENGKLQLNYDQMIIITELFDVSVDYLLGLKEY